jgi:hypothetical protein
MLDGEIPELNEQKKEMFAEAQERRIRRTMRSRKRKSKAA